MSTCEAQYRGRFAPSPTGPLHFGSLVAAVGSYLQARSRNGVWLVRMEDIDPPREQEGAASLILKTLEIYGLEWDGEVLFQSSQLEQYRQVLDELDRRQLTYPCTCTRRELRAQGVYKSPRGGVVYPGTCRQGLGQADGPSAVRVLVSSDTISFIDGLQGPCKQNLASDVGDFVLVRKDGLIAYQLAVVADDAAQGVSEVVRGVDLIDSTTRQIYLQQLLGLETPAYLHLPVVADRDGVKLSKQTGAQPLDLEQPSWLIVEALRFLDQAPPEDLAHEQPVTVLAWAIENWDPFSLRGVRNKFWPDPIVLAAAQ